jgi:hypothetical protein
MIYLILRSALFETPPAAAPQEKGRRLEARGDAGAALVRRFRQFLDTLVIGKA